MPIKDHPFATILGINRPMLWIRVTNPDTKQAVIELANVDTGADECVFPAKTATELGHKLESGAEKPIKTASGTTHAYSHTSIVDVLDMQPDGMPGSKVLYTISEMPVDFLPGCDHFLLGVGNFLKNFVLTIDYPRQRFSIRRSKN